MKLDSPLTELKGVGDKTAKKFEDIGVETIEDLLFTFPRSYTDYSQIINVKDLKPGNVTLKVRLHGINSRYSRRGLHITSAVASDDTGSVSVTWFNQSYRAESIDKGKEYYISGEYGFSNQRYSLINPSVEQFAAETKNTARIVPNYSERNGLKSYQIRPLIVRLKPFIKSIGETLPKSVKNECKLEDISEALSQIHFPDTSTKLEKAKTRLGFDEIFEFVLATQLQKDELKSLKAEPINADVKLAKEFVSSLPYDLTDAQRKASWAILKDMESKSPMNRLLQGDVGSGKTVVAAMAILMAVRSGKSAFFIAPTELLAKQQLSNLNELFKGFNVETELLVGSLANKAKDLIKKKIGDQLGLVTVGTHALFEDDVNAKDLGLIVIDEQHRFGVRQRQALAKQKKLPHVLTMSATPIPRSLALTLYGELDISILDEMPKGRMPVITQIFNERQRKQVYAHIEEMVKKKSQVFVVVPAVEEDNALSVTNVTSEYKKLQKEFNNLHVAYIHGKLKTDEKDKVMADFVSGKIQILIATTVIEVGVNVPSANVLLVEAAERFGLAQLHQLRGRVGRSSAQAYCYVAPSPGSKVNERLLALEQTSNGFELAELDLKIRGPGQIYGAKQHGLLDLKIATFTDIKLVNMAKDAAKSFIASGQDLVQYPRLHQRVKSVRAITNLN